MSNFWYFLHPQIKKKKTKGKNSQEEKNGEKNAFKIGEKLTQKNSNR